ncbi:MAG: hypothetical protein DRP89_02110 [Candidatus Neomarinimicrobiota bacterium]|nr:MAG: hypothetical protein DRP89_02110 [Candidatus Neomarinimicrobiota bacterium]
MFVALIMRRILGIIIRINILLLIFILFYSTCEEEPKIGINSLRFEGDYYLEVPNSKSIISLVEGSFTIEMWAAGSSSSPDVARTLFMVGNNEGGNEIGIYQGPYDSSLVWVFVDDKLFGSFNIHNLDWRVKKMHHLCLIRVDNFISFYFDGILKRREAISDLDLDIGSSNMLIGADYDPPGVNSNEGNFWYGYIDEVRIWSKDLKSTDVEFHYKNPDKLTQHYSKEGLNTLIGLWRFNNEDSEVVLDESSSQNDAYIRGNNGEVYWDTFGAD